MTQRTAAEQRLKTIENRLRRVASRQGLTLERRKRMDRRSTDYGTYRVRRTDTGELLHTGSLPDGWGLTLEQVAALLQEPTGGC